MNKMEDKWMPEIGEECEFWVSSDTWVKTVCDGHGIVEGENVAFVRYQGGHIPATHKTLRPLKTEAEKRRDEAVVAFNWE